MSEVVSSRTESARILAPFHHSWRCRRLAPLSPFRSPVRSDGAARAVFGVHAFGSSSVFDPPVAAAWPGERARQETSRRGECTDLIEPGNHHPRAGKSEAVRFLARLRASDRGVSHSRDTRQKPVRLRGCRRIEKHPNRSFRRRATCIEPEVFRRRIEWIESRLGRLDSRSEGLARRGGPRNKGGTWRSRRRLEWFLDASGVEYEVLPASPLALQRPDRASLPRAPSGPGQARPPRGRIRRMSWPSCPRPLASTSLASVAS